ncbi:MAG: hypothetical protein R3D63_03875 [Paracoccaceae bacterium]
MYPVILEPLYLYCERVGPGLLQEPLNLMSSLVFAPLGWAIWRGSAGLPGLRVLAVLTLLVAPASVALHLWPTLLTVSPVVGLILAILLQCFYLANREIMAMSRRMALACVLVVLPFAAVGLPLLAAERSALTSLAFVAPPILVLGYAAAVRDRWPATARGLLIAALVLVLGISLRTLDLPMCAAWPHGTQFLWKLLAALFLAQMARVYRAHMLAGPGGGG